MEIFGLLEGGRRTDRQDLVDLLDLLPVVPAKDLPRGTVRLPDRRKVGTDLLLGTALPDRRRATGLRLDTDLLPDRRKAGTDLLPDMDRRKATALRPAHTARLPDRRGGALRPASTVLLSAPPDTAIARRP